MTSENNTTMKTENCLKIALWEFRVNRGLFFFYLAIAVVLFSISVVVLSLAISLPDLIAGELKEVQADTISILGVTLEEAETALSLQVELIDSTLTPHRLSAENLSIDTGESFWGGLLLKGYDFIAEKLIEGRGASEASQSGDCYPIWISKKMSEETGLELDSRLTMLDFNGNEVCEVYIAGIYESSYHYHYYIPLDVYSEFARSHLNLRLVLYIRPIEFREFGRIISWADRINIRTEYNRDVILAVQMVYYTFFVLNFILLLTLVGIIANLVNTYFSSRLRFYAINSAVGMSSSGIMRIMFLLCQIFIIVAIALSCGASFIILESIKSYVQRYFSFAEIGVIFPIFPILINWVLLQMLASLMLIIFYKKVKGRDIVSAIRCE